MNKFRHIRRFVWVTDCYAMKFILLYDGANQAILRLQMQLMGWDVDIAHWRNNHLVNADYWSCLDCNLCYGPSFRSYLCFVKLFRTNHPPPTEIPIDAEQMPYYRGPRIHELRSSHNTSDQIDTVTNAAPQIDEAAAALLTNIVTSRDLGPTSLGIRPVEFGTFHTPESASTDQPARELYNSEFTALAYSVMRFRWAAYGFNSGHFISTIKQRNLPFSIVLACDPYAHGCALLNEVAKFQNVLHGASALLNHIGASGNASPIEGYIIHSHCYQSSKPSTAFWLLQASIVDFFFQFANCNFSLHLFIQTTTAAVLPNLCANCTPADG
jgi:hypothetical protein